VDVAAFAALFLTVFGDAAFQMAYVSFMVKN